MTEQLAPRRDAMGSELIFVVLAGIVTTMWVLGLLSGALSGGLGAVVLIGFGAQIALISVVPLIWSLVRRRGRVVAMVWWSLLALGGAFALLLLLPAAFWADPCTTSHPC